MYFLCGGLAILAAICTLFLEETRGKVLADTLDKSIKVEHEPKETTPLLKNQALTSPMVDKDHVVDKSNGAGHGYQDNLCASQGKYDGTTRV